MANQDFIARPGIDAPLADFVSISDFGAVGDGVANDTAAIQAALNTGKAVLVPKGTFKVQSTLAFAADGQQLYGLGNTSVLIDATSAANFININGRDGASVCNLKVDATAGSGGGSAAGIAIGSSSRNTVIDKVYFHGGGQRVWLFTTDTVRVTNCTFKETGYGVIQQTGFSSSDVLVANCTAINMVSDFVEANCASAPSFNWVISNNVFEGCSGWPTRATESRFVGITGVNGVVIEGNTAKRVCGDAAVHLEDIGGEIVINGNYFVDVLGTGYVYLLNTAENCVISGNIFEHRDATINPAPAVWSLNNYSQEITFTGNRVKGTSSNKVFDAFAVGFFNGGLNVVGNTFDTLASVLSQSTCSWVNFTGNQVISCTDPFVKVGAVGSSFRDFLIANNQFKATTGTHDIRAGANGSGTGAPKRCYVTGNKFSKNVSFTGHIGHPVGGEGDADNIVVTNNVFAAGAALDAPSGTMTFRRYSENITDASATYAADFSSLSVSGTATCGTLAATSVGNNVSLVEFDVTDNKVGWECYQGGVYLDGVEGDYTQLGEAINKTATGSKYLYIGTGFILRQGYSGDVTIQTGTISGGLFYVELQSSPDHVTWTTDGSFSTGGTTNVVTYTNIAQPLALRVRLRNSNGTSGNTTLNRCKISNLTVQDIIQACGGPTANYSVQPSFPKIATTASAANAFIDNASAPANRLLLSTSSVRYKTDIEDLETLRADAILGLRPIWYRSLSEADPSEWSYYGLLAEEVAEIEPRLVTWTYPEGSYELVEETITVTNEDGEEEEVTYEVNKLKPDAEKIPNGVQYERLSVLLLSIIQRQEERIKALESKI